MNGLVIRGMAHQLGHFALLVGVTHFWSFELAVLWGISGAAGWLWMLNKGEGYV